MIADYPGTVLLVSHDRDFLDRTVTSTLAAEGDGRWTEYAGGYSDMLAQRGGATPLSDLAAPARSKPKGPPAAARVPAAAARRKLSFRDKHSLETLPGRIEALQSELATLHAKLADPALFSRSPDAFAGAAAAVHAAERELASAEEEWLRLELLREEIEG